MAQQKENKKRLACPECSSTNFYTNKNERVCRRCGFVGSKKDFVFDLASWGKTSK